ncbi:hypothetical protein BJY04DRAFT_199641 [Aspergillus karnatakaensis]|uniref:uncharacterized protein n=1 Tax=Aspergillus karnatakaensis TaxID=1810916 RepID=UPI003CCDC1BE
MGAPHLSGSYLTLLDYLFNLAHGECGLSQFEADGCAASAEELEAVGQCIRARGWQVAVANALSILPLFSLDACNRQVEFFGRDEVVGVLVPAYAREFAAGL